LAQFTAFSLEAPASYQYSYKFQDIGTRT